MVVSRRKTGELTEAKLLKAARDIFIEKGFSGASMGRIARLAEMNQSLIYHYYPSKEDLWNKVKEDLMASFSEKGTAIPNMSDPSLENVLDVLFTRRIEFYRENDDIVRLFKWQALEGGWGSSPTQKKYLLAWVK